MTIITNDMRGKINFAVMQHAYKSKVAELTAEANDLKRQVYERFYDAETRAAIGLIRDKFPTALFSRSIFRVNVGGATLMLGFRGQSHVYSISLVSQHAVREDQAIFRMLDLHRDDNQRMLDLEADDELGKAIMDFCTRVDALDAEMSARRQEIAGVMSGFRTDGQIEAGWPDVMPIAR